MEEEHEEEIQEEQEQLDPFMVEDKDEAMDVCSMCSLLRKDNMICGTFKARDDFRKSKGYPAIEDTFYCSDFKEVEE